MEPKHDPLANRVTCTRPSKHDYTTQNFAQSLQEGIETRREATRSIAQPKNKENSKKNSHLAIMRNSPRKFLSKIITKIPSTHSVPQPEKKRKKKPKKFLHPFSTHNKGPATLNHSYNSQQFEPKINNFKELTTENRKEQPTTI
jgi:hypothetical protein